MTLGTSKEERRLVLKAKERGPAEWNPQQQPQQEQRQQQQQRQPQEHRKERKKKQQLCVITEKAGFGASSGAAVGATASCFTVDFGFGDLASADTDGAASAVFDVASDGTDDADGFDGAALVGASSPTSAASKASRQTAEDAAEIAYREEVEAHQLKFVRRTGMSPRLCFRLVLVCLALRLMGGVWIGMVLLEYLRYYVVNDLDILAFIDTATDSPQCLVKAFLFPFWGVFADRVSRRKVLVLSSVAGAAAALLLSMAPSLHALPVVRLFNLVADGGYSIRNAMLRDIFSPMQWERLSGGATGIQSRMAIFGTISSSVAVALGMSLLKLAELNVVDLPNEYTSNKETCAGQRHCVVPSDAALGFGSWRVEGSLRLLMLLGTLMLLMEAMLVVMLMPETLPEDNRLTSKITTFVRQHWKGLFAPWNNLRVFATDQLKTLLGIRILHYVIGSGFTQMFLAWYRRHEPDSFTMQGLMVAGGVTGFLTLLVVSRLVVWFGDLRGVWIPGNLFTLGYGLSVVLIPAGHVMLCFIAFPLFLGPGGGLSGFTPWLMAKLVPGDVQGTFQTATSFAYNTQRAVMVWPWVGLLVASSGLPYPLDMLPVWFGLVLGILALVWSLKQVPRDPRIAISEGRALDEFLKTRYAAGKWYRYHGGRCRDDATKLEEGAGGPMADIMRRAAIAEGSSKVGFFVVAGDDAGIAAHLKSVSELLPKLNSLSVVWSFVEGDDIFASMPRSTAGGAATAAGTAADAETEGGGGSSRLAKAAPPPLAERTVENTASHGTAGHAAVAEAMEVAADDEQETMHI